MTISESLIENVWVHNNAFQFYVAHLHSCHEFSKITKNLLIKVLKLKFKTSFLTSLIFCLRVGQIIF